MLVHTIPLQCLWGVAQDYRNDWKRSLFYKSVAVFSSPTDFTWIRHLYYLPSSFTAKVGFLSRISSLPLVLLWLAYTLVGWYLSTYHTIWLVGAFVAVLGLATASRSSLLLKSLVRFASQGWVVVLILSTSAALTVIWSILLTLIIVPLVTTILAKLEMRFAGLSKLYTFLVLTAIAGFGLGMGKIIDIMLLPSMRY